MPIKHTLYSPVSCWPRLAGVAAALGGALGLVGPAAGSVQYTVEILRNAPASPVDTAQGRPGVTASRPAHHGLNNHGDITGSGYTGGYSRPYFYHGGTGTIANLGDTTGDFGDPADPSANGSSAGYAVNELGWVAGRSDVAPRESGSSWRPFVWADADGNGARNGDEMLQLELSPGMTRGSARAINDAGYVLIDGDNGLYRTRVQLDGGALTEVGSRIQITDGATLSAASMNNAGDVIYNDADHSYVWRDLDGNGRVDSGETTQLASMSLGFQDTRAYGINDRGQVVGTMKNGNGKTVGFLWTDHDGDNVMDWDDENGNGAIDADEVSDEVVRFTADKDGLTGSEGNLFARATNDLGQVVGSFATASRYAILWDADHGVRNLNDLIAPSLGITLSQAEAINDLGQIAAYGRYAGSNTEHLVLLTPVPEPTTLTLLGLGGVVLVRRGARRIVRA